MRGQVEGASDEERILEEVVRVCCGTCTNRDTLN